MTSIRVDIENNFEITAGFEFMNLWVIFLPIFRKLYLNLEIILILNSNATYL